MTLRSMKAQGPSMIRRRSTNASKANWTRREVTSSTLLPDAHYVLAGVLLSGPVLGAVIASLLTLTTTLYLTHDREAEAFDLAPASNQTRGYWGEATGDFNWCEPDYVYSPYVVEVWNSITRPCTPAMLEMRTFSRHSPTVVPSCRGPSPCGPVHRPTSG